MSKVKLKRHFYNVFSDWDFDLLLMIGGYGSGKSFTGFLKVATKASIEPRKVLVVRKVFSTLKESCYEDLEDSMSIAGVDDEWKFVKSPMEARCKNGSRFVFKGMDNKKKIKSIKNIDLVIVEEADELSLDELKELKKRLRVKGKKLHMILMCNPVSRSSSVYKWFFTPETDGGYGFDEEELYEKRFLEKRNKAVLANEEEYEEVIKVHHSTYLDNPELPASYRYDLENEKDERVKRIGTEGKFGADGELLLPNACFETGVYERYVLGKLGRREQFRGIDWGYSTSFTAGLKMAVNFELNELYIYWEYYEKDKQDDELQSGLQPLQEGNIPIYADSEDPKTIDNFYDAGFNMYGAKKWGGSVAYGEQMLRSFSRIVIDSNRCPNAKREAEECVFKKTKMGDLISGEYNIDPHTFDAMKYGLEPYSYIPLKQKLKRYKRR